MNFINKSLCLIVSTNYAIEHFRSTASMCRIFGNNFFSYKNLIKNNSSSYIFSNALIMTDYCFNMREQDSNIFFSDARFLR